MKTYLREGERAADGVGVQGCLSILCALLGDLLALLELSLLLRLDIGNGEDQPNAAKATASAPELQQRGRGGRTLRCQISG